MVVLLKRLLGKKYDLVHEHYVSKQKDVYKFRLLDTQAYVWIQGVGEQNRDTDEETKITHEG